MSWAGRPRQQETPQQHKHGHAMVSLPSIASYPCVARALPATVPCHLASRTVCSWGMLLPESPVGKEPGKLPMTETRIFVCVSRLRVAVVVGVLTADRVLDRVHVWQPKTWTELPAPPPLDSWWPLFFIGSFVTSVTQRCASHRAPPTGRPTLSVPTAAQPAGARCAGWQQRRSASRRCRRW